MLRVLSEEDERCRREGVGWVAPVRPWLGFGSEISIGRSDAFAEAEDTEEALLATEADWARSAVSSRVKRLTCSTSSVRVLFPPSVDSICLLFLPLLLVPSHIRDTAQLQ